MKGALFNPQYVKMTKNLIWNILFLIYFNNTYIYKEICIYIYLLYYMKVYLCVLRSYKIKN